MLDIVAGAEKPKQRRNNSCNFDESSSSSISSLHMRNTIECLKSTRDNYLSVWCKFNNFIIRLDVRPVLWEDRASLFGAYLVEEGIQSSTLRSYMSAIKGILVDDGYEWDNNKLLLSTLIRGCKVENDRTVQTRLPIQCGLLEMILFEVQCLFQDQYYLEIMYKTLLVLAYYGLFRIGELTMSSHVLQARDVHIAHNKNKLLFFLRSSKTHGTGNKPQEIKIMANESAGQRLKNVRYFCPFTLSREYLAIRGNYVNDFDPFFVFRDWQPVKAAHVRGVLRKATSALGLNATLYNTHSLRSGRSIDLLKAGKTLSEVKSAGRWKSNVVYRYIKKF